MTAEKLTDGYGLIEGPVWHPTMGLLFSDVLFGGVFAVTPDGAVSTVFEHRRGIGGMALASTGGAEATGLVVSGRNIAYKPFDGGETVVLLDRDEAAGLVGFNDITTDAAGRIYAGGLGASPVFDLPDQPTEPEGGQPRAADLHLIDLDGSARPVAADVRLTNGLGFSPDGSTLYHSDSARGRVFRYDVADDGGLGSKEEFVRTEHGAPDGLVVSTDGAVWVAEAGGGGVGVYEADGSHRTLIEIPEPMCTSVCFGGDDLGDLYIVSGSDGADSDRAGAVYRVPIEANGLPVAMTTIPAD